MRTFVLSCAALALLLLPPSAAMAATTYFYTGNDYTLIIDNTPPAGTTYTTSMSVTGSFTVASALAPNMALTDISSDVISYSFNDGVNTLTESNSSLVGALNVATDAGGDIIEWQITTETVPRCRASVAPATSAT